MSITYDKLPHAAQVIVASCIPDPRAPGAKAYWDDYARRNGGVIEATVTINGFTFDLLPFAENLEAQWDRAVTEAASESLRQKVRALRNKIERIDETINDAFPEIRDVDND